MLIENWQCEMVERELQDVEPGDRAVFFTCEPGDDFAWVTDLEHFDDVDVPVETVRQHWVLERAERIRIHPSLELCNECGGDPEQFGGCGTCDGTGEHPMQGQIEVLSEITIRDVLTRQHRPE